MNLRSCLIPLKNSCSPNNQPRHSLINNNSSLANYFWDKINFPKNCRDSSGTKERLKIPTKDSAKKQPYQNRSELRDQVHFQWRKYDKTRHILLHDKIQISAQR